MNDLWPPEQPRRRRIDWGLWLQVLLAIVALAAAGWFIYREFQQPSASTVKDGTGLPAATPERPQESDSRGVHSAQIITCQAEDGSMFYTNASSCEEADLDNRVSVVSSSPDESGDTPDCITSNPDWETSVRFLVGCQEPFMQALELEKFLTKAPDPLRSPRITEYCGLIADGVSAGCMANDAVFCLLPVCQELASQQHSTP